MNREEACAILEIPKKSTPEEAKKKFRELSKKYHPDINKEPGAADKFKKINEAYQVISTGKDNGPTVRRQPQFPDTIELHTTISFKDSVLGCKSELKFNRNTKCKDCGGQGEIPQNNGCDKCNGKGQIVNREGYMVSIQTCGKCFGRVSRVPCNACDSNGVLEAEATINVSIPGGVQSGNILRLGGVGHYLGSFGPIEQHTDVFLHIAVTPEPGLQLVGNDVVTKVELPLLDALKGCKKNVNTILGTKEIDVKPKSRNKDEVIIPHLGVNRLGNQRVILDVQYPENIDPLVNILTEGAA